MSYRARLAIALVTIYLVWGSTYLAIAIAVRTIPPLSMAAVRFLTAGIVLYGAMRARGIEAPSRSETRTAAIVGVFLLVGGNGLVTTNAHALPSGVVALLIATTPLFMVLLPILFGGEKPRAVVIAATALGLAGVGTLVRPSGAEAALPMMNVLGIVGAALSWSVGSLISKRMPAPASSMMATAQQMTLGGLALLVVAAFRGELSQIDVSTFSTDSLLALAYLTIFGSVTGFGAYVWLLRNTSPAVATSYAYVNPLVALVFGSVLADEPFGRRTFFAGALIIAAVVLLVTDAGRIGRRAKSDSTGG